MDFKVGDKYKIRKNGVIELSEKKWVKAVVEQPTAYDVENMISEVEVKMKAMWYFLDCHSAQCDNESGGDCSYCKKDFYDEIDKIVEQLKNELSNH